MQLTTSNPKYANAFASELPIGLCLTVNTQKGMYLIRSSSGGSASGDHFASWHFAFEDNESSETEIKLIAQTDAEKELLRGVEYSLHDRGQFEILLVNRAHLIERKALASTSKN